MQKIAVIGSGYVGLVTAACLSELGNKVICVDNDLNKIKSLNKGIIPIYEPGLEEMISKNKKSGRIIFSPSIKQAVEKSQVIFICVGTPSHTDGSADLSAVEKVASEIAKAMKEYKVIVEKSTVPAETGGKIRRTIEMSARHKVSFDVVSNPEFLREGQGLSDAMRPDRIVIGVESKVAEEIMRRLYKPLKAPIIVCNIETAEIIKHASNSFLATKISFINAISHICEKVGADVEKVAEAMGLDKRIGKAFLNAGAGYGGSCFPKDVEAFIHLAHHKGYDFELLKTVRKINEDQKKILFKKIEEALWIIKGKTVGVLGLSFKPDTDDIRASVGIAIVRMLQQAGAIVKAYDPKAMPKAKIELKGIKFCRTAYEVAKDSNCLLIMTEWEEFRSLDLNKIKKVLSQPIVIDGRNIFDPQRMKKLGFLYKCIGRGV
ncbi:MAG: UDP-glucose/GDP-mannose dehydrogenase family protein [Candidatus Omnitrophica bacterium]|nr:UDP-glucose/GDP-mannose dehydrogenase family protein [Candidatus Omnitrophota bacterium]